MFESVCKNSTNTTSGLNDIETCTNKTYCFNTTVETNVTEVKNETNVPIVEPEPYVEPPDPNRYYK